MENEIYTWDKVNSWDEELALLKTILNKTELIETTKWGGPVYTVSNKNVVGVAGFKKFFTLWFFHGVFLSDPRKVLVNANEGVTKSLRQWRFTSKAEIDEKAILEYVKEAIDNAKAGKAIKPEAKSKNFEIPELLQTALKNAKLESNFAAFTPFKQREFSEYLAEAKQQKTQLDRVEKILQMIGDGVGLHDKYIK